MNVFVIIVTYNGRYWYDKCFSSLRESSVPVTTVVVDNASTDGSVPYLREHFPEVVILESKENLGFGKANNIGMRYALDHGCDFVFLLNQDTWIETDSIMGLIRIHQSYPGYGILSPMHLKADGRSLYIQIEDGNTDHGNKFLSDCYFGTLEDVYTFTYVNAAAWLLPRVTLEKVGGFDPMFIHYGEDDDYLNRIRYHGLKLGLCPKSQIVHDHQASVNPLVNSRLRRYQTLLVRFLDLNRKPTLDGYLRHTFSQIVKAYVRLDFNKAREKRDEYCFFRSRRKDIIRHRKINSQNNASWL